MAKECFAVRFEGKDIIPIYRENKEISEGKPRKKGLSNKESPDKELQKTN